MRDFKPQITQMTQIISFGFSRKLRMTQMAVRSHNLSNPSRICGMALSTHSQKSVKSVQSVVEKE